MVIVVTHALAVVANALFASFSFLRLLLDDSQHICAPCYICLTIYCVPRHHYSGTAVETAIAVRYSHHYSGSLTPTLLHRCTFLDHQNLYKIIQMYHG